MKKLLTLVAAAVVVLAPRTVAAQNTATIVASATVLATLNAVKEADLNFASVFPGLVKTIAVTDAGAARVQVIGEGGREVNITFTLPTDLVSGANLLPIGSYTSVWNTTATAVGGTTINPVTGGNLLLNAAAPFNAYVFLGGTVTPAAGQSAGFYTADITLTAAYTGN